MVFRGLDLLYFYLKKQHQKNAFRRSANWEKFFHLTSDIETFFFLSLLSEALRRMGPRITITVFFTGGNKTSFHARDSGPRLSNRCRNCHGFRGKKRLAPRSAFDSWNSHISWIPAHERAGRDKWGGWKQLPFEYHAPAYSWSGPARLQPFLRRPNETSRSCELTVMKKIIKLCCGEELFVFLS